MSQSLALAKKPHIVIGESLTQVNTTMTIWVGDSLKCWVTPGEWTCDSADSSVSSLFSGKKMIFLPLGP